MARMLVATLLASLLMHSAIAHAKDKGPITKENIQLQTDYGTVILHNLSLEQTRSGVLVSGVVTNQTDRAWRKMGFSVTLRDKSGREIKSASPFDDSILREVMVEGLGKGETKPLTGYSGRSPAMLPLTLNGKVIDFDMLWVKAHSHYDSRTIFALVQPSQNNALSHEDDSIVIHFTVAGTELQFTLENKTQQPLSINWDEVSFIDLSGTAHRVLHQGVKLADKDRSQPPTVIPPGTNIKDLIAPADGVEFNTALGDWRYQPLLPPSQEIVDHKGKTFGVFMPLVINGQKKNYTFTIRIDDVEI